MKKKTKLLLLMLVVSILAISPFNTNIGIPTTIIAEAAGKIEMSCKTASVHEGESMTLQLKNVPTKGKVTWETSNSKIVSITKKSGSKATIKGIKKGTATISATYNKKKYVCKITVNGPAKLNITSSNLKILETKTITLSNAIGSRKVTWKCSDTKIATIKANKNTVTVTGKAAGTVKITAVYGGKNYTCTIKVLSVSINKKNTELTVGASETLQLSNAVAGKATWSTSNKSIVSVTPNKNKDKATIKALKTGTATITAKIGGKSYTCKVTVKKKNNFYAAVTNVRIAVNENKTINIYSDNGEMNYEYIGDSTIADCKWGTWTSENCCPIKITGENVGTTTILITEIATGKTLKIKVEVYSNNSVYSNPNFSVLMSNRRYTSTHWIAVAFTNKGNKPLRIYSQSARSSDPYYSSLNRNLTLAGVASDQESIETYRWQEIEPNSSRVVTFFTENPTFYDGRTRIYYRFSYDYKMYNACSSYYYGSRYW